MNTPYYVIDKEELNQLIDSLNHALKKCWNNYIIGYSYKTNALPWIVNYFREKGCYAEVVSEDEYELAKTIKTPIDNIIYNGPIKSKETFVEAVNKGSIVNIDSWREIEWLSDVKPGSRVGIRVNYDIEKICSGESSAGKNGSRFGFCYENQELYKALRAIQEKDVMIAGLHLHISSKTRSIDIYRASARKACEIAKKYNLILDYVDLGGGFFGGLSNKPQFDDYLQVIQGELEKYFDYRQTKLIIEPGMSVIGAPVSYVASVIDVKDTEYGRFVVTDGSRTNIDPLMTKKNYFHTYEYNSIEKREILKQSIVGYTCMENDRFFLAEGEKELLVGDRIHFHKVGAYTMCLTPLFIKYYPDVYVKDNGEMMLVRGKWSVKEFMQNNRGMEKNL